MFIDQVTVEVKAGKGGDGMVAFRREKYVPNGGPAGGDGGKGGSVVFVVDEGLRTLMDFRFNRHFRAKPGENGMIKGMHGRGSDDLFVKVPPGTIVKNAETGTFLGDLVENGDKLVVAKGGRGGRGNIRFASPRNPAPEIAENGEPGVEIKVHLELRVLADVGLVGFPSVGKSTLLSVVTSAKPKIASYHFTTLTPNLGMVRTDDGRSFVMADLPGLIEGASLGVGLGIQFLRHIERTRVILHVIDMSGSEEREPFEDYLKINEELRAYDPALLKRPQIIVANKMDMPTSEDNLAIFKQKLVENASETEGEREVFAISALAHQGLDPLLRETADVLEQTPAFEMTQDDSDESVMYTFKPDGSAEFEVEPTDEAWIISGEKVEKLLKMTNLSHDESIMRFARQLRAMGIDDALRAKGAVNGDTIRILDFEFEFLE